MGDDARACAAARVSLLNDDVGSGELSARDLRLLEFLLREKHTSPFEHSVITFRICAPLPVVAQIMRHRTFSYNQSSRRYTSEDIEFYDLSEWRAQAAKNLQCSDGALPEASNAELRSVYREHCVRSLKIYEWMLERGASREQARFVLPQGLMARFWMTGNLHNYLKFLLLRDDVHAQGECRDVARSIRALLTQEFPATLSLFANVLSKETVSATDSHEARSKEVGGGEA
jgi:thymidylate synthase (FAD)